MIVSVQRESEDGVRRVYIIRSIDCTGAMRRSRTVAVRWELARASTWLIT